MAGKERENKVLVFLQDEDNLRIFTPLDSESSKGALGFVIGYNEAIKLKRAEAFIAEKVGKGKPTVVITGSFRFKDSIDSTIDFFNHNGVEVLAPEKGKVKGETETGFKILENDDELADEIELEARFLQAVANADALYIYNPRGYIGDMVEFEIAIGGMSGVPMYSLEPLPIRHGRDRTRRKAIPVLAPSTLMDILLNIEQEKLNTSTQFWVMEKRNRVRIFPFTDHEGQRAIFIDDTPR